MRVFRPAVICLLMKGQGAIGEAAPDTSDRLSAVVVSGDAGARAVMADALRGLGVSVHEADGFAGGRELIAETAPHVLITDLRLGAYNGLHLVLRLRATAPRLKAIVLVETPDPVLEREALRLDAELLVKDHGGAWVSLALAAVAPYALQGRSPAGGPAGGA